MGINLKIETRQWGLKSINPDNEIWMGIEEDSGDSIQITVDSGD